MATKFNQVKITEHPSQSLTINKSKGSVNGVLERFIVQDGDYIVAILPALNISGYGKDMKEANEMLLEGVNDFFESLINLKQEAIEVELGKYGWKQGLFKKRFENKAFVDENGILKDFELPKDTPVSKSLIEVA